MTELTDLRRCEFCLVPGCGWPVCGDCLAAAREGRLVSHLKHRRWGCRVVAERAPGVGFVVFAERAAIIAQHITEVIDALEGESHAVRN